MQFLYSIDIVFFNHSAVVNGKVCVFGGRDAMDSLIAEVDCYDPVADSWSTIANLPAERQTSDFAIFAKDNNVYLIGGYDQAYYALDRTTIMDMSDTNAITYTDGPKLRSKRGDIDVAVMDGNAYVSGGFTHENDYAAPKNSVERYSLETQTWDDVDALNEERGDKQVSWLLQLFIACFVPRYQHLLTNRNILAAGSHER